MNFQLLDGNNLKIRAAIEGEGPLVVLVHGWPESWYSWRHQIPKISKAGYTAAAIDVRGYGESDKPHEINAYSLKNISNDVIELAITDADAFTNTEKSEADANKIHKTAVKQANKEIGI